MLMAIALSTAGAPALVPAAAAMPRLATVLGLGALAWARQRRAAVVERERFANVEWTAAPDDTSDMCYMIGEEASGCARVPLIRLAPRSTPASSRAQ